MDCAHIDSLNIKNYIWHYSPYLWLTTHFLCSFPLRLIMVAAILTIRACRPGLLRLQRPEHIPLAYSGKPCCVWRKLSTYWKQGARQPFHSIQDNLINEEKGQKCLYTKYHRHIKIRFTCDQSHPTWSPPDFSLNTLLQMCLAQGPQGFPLCVWPSIYYNNYCHPQSVTRCMNVFLPSPDH